MKIQAIKKYMKDKHITYELLAQRSNLSISTIKKIFSGISQYPRIDTMQAIERALGLEITETKLSDDEAEWLDLYKELKNAKGGKNAVQAVKSVILAFLDKK